MTEAIEMSTPITLRPMTDGDMEFLQRLYSTTRPDIDAAPLTDEQRRQILQQQFEAQHNYYQSQFPRGQFDVILADDQPIGRLYVERNDEEIRLLDFALIPERRNHGIGSGILQDLLEEAGKAGLPMRLWVEIFNPSFRFFTRFGFKRVVDPTIDWEREANQHLEWLPAT